MPSMSDHVRSTAQTYPDEIALTQNGVHLTYGTLLKEIDAATGKLKALGLKSQDKVALALPNLKETVVLFYALNALGITVVMLHPLSSTVNLKARCEFMKVNAVFVLDLLEKQTEGHLDAFRVIRVKAVNGILGQFLRLRHPFYRPKSLDWDKVMPVDFALPHFDHPDSVVLFSSGTSGTQKAISLSDASFEALVKQMESVIDPKRGVDSMFCVLPFFHGFGLGIGMHTVLALGGRCILVPRLKKKTLIETFLKEKPTYLAAVPYLLKVLLQDERFTKADLSFVRQVFVGGETVPKRLIEAFNAVLSAQGSKAKVQVGYGCTETVTAVTLMTMADSGKDGVGVPFIGNQLLILKDDETPAKTHETGEILISGPTLMNGYWGDQKATEAAFWDHDGQRYYKTKDLGHLDDQGILHFHHRKDDLIKVKGYLIDPQTILDRLSPIEVIHEMKLLIDDQDRLTVLLTVKDETDLASLQQKTIQAVHDLDGWCQPQRFAVIKAFPLNEMRKIDLKRLKSELKSQALGFQSEWFL